MLWIAAFSTGWQSESGKDEAADPGAVAGPPSSPSAAVVAAWDFPRPPRRMERQNAKRAGLLQTLANIGGPGRTRTSNQTVMSGPVSPETSNTIDVFRQVRARSFAPVHGVSVVYLWSVRHFPKAADKRPRAWLSRCAPCSIHSPEADSQSRLHASDLSSRLRRRVLRQPNRVSHRTTRIPYAHQSV